MTMPPIKQKACHLIETIEKHGFETRFVGGCVRDELLGKSPADYDLAGQATPEQLKEIAAIENIKFVPTGVEHGTATLVYLGSPFEVTTLRSDIKTDGRKAEVSFTSDFAVDASRRDFTINALYQNRSGEVFDFFDGQKDLAARVLRFVGDAEKRCQEDYLRILRMYRFWGQLGFMPDDMARKAAKSLAHNIKSLSQERITDEFRKLLQRSSNLEIYNALESDLIWQELLKGPHITVSEWLTENESVILNYQGKHKDCFLFSQLHIHDELAEKNLRAFILSNQDIKRILAFLSFEEFVNRTPADQASAMDYLDTIEEGYGELGFMNVFLPMLKLVRTERSYEESLNQLEQVEKNCKSIRKAKVPISGHHVKDRFGLEDGPELGRIMKRLKRAFRNGEWQDQNKGLQLVATWMTEI